MSNVIAFPGRPALALEPRAVVIDETVPMLIGAGVGVLQLARGLATVGLQVTFDARTGALVIRARD